MSLLCRSSNGSPAGGVFPQCKLCRRPARSHRCCSWTRLRRPLLYNDWCLGYDSTENSGISAVAVLSRWSMTLSMQFIDGCGRPCAYAATSGLSLEVPQTQFIARAGGHFSCRDRGLRRGLCGGDVGLGIFRAPPGRPGVERQFSEPSMTKSSLLSRAPANLS